MKKTVLFFTFILCSFFAIKADAQYYINEGFETSVPPTGWYVTDYTDGSSSWIQSSTQKRSGTYSAFSNYGPAAGDETWLVSPRVTVQSGDSLSFWLRKQYTSNYIPDSLIILISTTDTNKASFVQVAGYNVNSLTGSVFNYRAVSLDAFNGQQVYIAFRHYNEDGNGVFMDDVRAGQPASVDVGVSSVGTTGSIITRDAGGSIIPTGTVNNYGGSAATFTVTRRISPGGYVDTQTITNLASGSSQVVNFASWNWTVDVNYTIKDSVYIAGDVNHANDTLTGFLSYQSIKQTLIINVDPRSADSLKRHLNLAGLSGHYNEAVNSFPPVSINNWRTLIVLFGDGGNWSASFRDSLRNYLDGSTPDAKRSLLIFGNDLGYANDPRRNTTVLAADSILYRQYLHAQYWADDWIDAFLTADSTAKGITSPFTTITSQRVRDPYPDLVAPATWNAGSGTVTSALVPVTETGDGDSCVAIAYSGNYNVFYGTNVYWGYVATAGPSLTPQGVVFNIIRNYIEENGGELPVELASFTSSIDNRKVTLNWSTVTEENNSGFTIERKLTGAAAWSAVGNVTGAGTSNIAQNYSFSEANLATGRYNYRLKQVDFNGNFEYFNLANEVIIGVPSKFALGQNYPNPFNPTTNINYDLPFDSKVSIRIFDMTGREVSQIVNQLQPAGYYTFNFNASALSSGVYFYQIAADGGNQQFVKTMKMVLVK
jgi:hypothetical protein